MSMGWAMVLLTVVWLVNGFYIQVSAMPLWMRWLHWTTPMKYMNDIIGMSMMKGVDWGTCSFGNPCYNGHSPDPFSNSASSGDILKTLSYKISGYPDMRLHRVDTQRSWFVLVAMAVSCRFVGLYYARKNFLS